MIPGYLLLCLAGGILWADRGGAWPPELARWAIPVGAVVVLLAQLGAPPRRRRTSLDLRAPALLIAGLVCFDVGWTGLSQRLREAAQDAERARWDVEGGVRLAEARVVDRRAHRWGETVILDRIAVADGGPALPRRLQLRIPVSSRPGASASAGAPPAPSRAERLLQPGAFVRLGLRIAPLGGTRNPGSPDSERVAARRGLAARARLPDPSWVLARAGPAGLGDRLASRARAARAGIRRRVEARWGARGSTGGVGLARALALGDRSGLPDSTRSAFEHLGLAHLLAVSGLHVGLVAGLAGWLTLRWAVRVPAFERLGAGRLFPLPMLVAGLAAALYAGLSGAGVSVSRACALLWLVVGLRLAGRSPAPVGALAVIGGGLLARDPAALFDLGAQLSFGSCLALWVGGVWTGPSQDSSGPFEVPARDSVAAPTASRCAPWNGASGGTFASAPGAVALRALLATMKVSLVVSLGTVGILGAHGLRPAWLGPIFNSLAIPWTAVLTLPGALMALVWTLLGPSGPGSDRMLELLLWPAGALARAAERTAALEPVGWLVDRPGSLPWLVAAAVGGLGLLALRRRRESLGVLIWLGLALVGLAPPQAGEALGRAPRVVFFDVGQGDAALVESEAHSILIDTGPGPPDGSGGRRLVRALRSLGLRRIDVLVVTHADLDHRGGAEHVLATLKPRELWLPAPARLDPALLRLAAQARGQGARVRWRSAGSGLESLDPDLSLRILWPPAGASGLSRNDGSLVLAVDLRAARFLFTADVGASTERALARLEAEALVADVLKLGHHGSRHSTTAGFLKAVAPRIAVLSAPCRPTRGLPSPAVLERLRAHAIPIVWTGRHGALAVEAVGAGPGEGRRDGRGVPKVQAWARPRLCGGMAGPGRGSASDEAGWTPLGEGALGLPGVLGPPERTSQRLLPFVGRGPIEALDLAHAAERGLHGEGCVPRNLVGGLEGPRAQRFRGYDLVQQPDRERSLRVDRARRQQQLRRVTAGNLPGQEDRGMTSRIESEGHLLEGKGCPGHGVSDLRREQQIESPGAGMPVDGRDERHAQRLRNQRGGRNGSQSLEGLGRHALAARQRLGDRNRLVHVHPGAEALLSGARQDGDADRVVGVDPLPVGRQIAQGLEVEGVGSLGSIQGDQGDVGMSIEAFESGGHQAVLAGPEPRRESPALARTRSGRLLDPGDGSAGTRDGRGHA